jgi:hypothetical protein
MEFGSEVGDDRFEVVSGALEAVDGVDEAFQRVGGVEYGDPVGFGA